MSKKLDQKNVAAWAILVISMTIVMLPGLKYLEMTGQDSLGALFLYNLFVTICIMAGRRIK